MVSKASVLGDDDDEESEDAVLGLDAVEKDDRVDGEEGDDGLDRLDTEEDDDVSKASVLDDDEDEDELLIVSDRSANTLTESPGSNSRVVSIVILAAVELSEWAKTVVCPFITADRSYALGKVPWLNLNPTR